MKFPPFSAAAVAALFAFGFLGKASAVTLSQYHGKTGLAFSNPITVCGNSYDAPSFKSVSFSAPNPSFGSNHHSVIWSSGGFNFDFSSYTSPTSGGTFALSGLGVGKPFKKPAVSAVEPKQQPPQPPQGPGDGNGTEKVPDGGSTLLMLGASLLGLHGFVRLLRPSRT